LELDYKPVTTFDSNAAKELCRKGDFQTTILASCLLQSTSVIHSGSKQNMLFIRLVFLLVMLFVLVRSDDTVLLLSSD